MQNNKIPFQQTLNSQVFKIFLAGVPGKLNKSKFFKFLEEELGLVDIEKNIEIPYNTQKMLTKGFVIIHIDSSDKFEELLKIKTFRFENRILHAKPFAKGKDLEKIRESYEQRKIYVAGIPKNWNKKKLSDIMAKFGKILDAYIIVNPKTQESQGFGYVEFNNPISAHKAIKLKNLQYNETTLTLERCSKLKAKILREKKERKEELKNQFENNYEKEKKVKLNSEKNSQNFKKSIKSTFPFLLNDIEVNLMNSIDISKMKFQEKIPRDYKSEEEFRKKKHFENEANLVYRRSVYNPILGRYLIIE